MKLVTETPVKLRILDTTPEEQARLKTLLTYVNKAAQYDVNRFKKGKWYIEKHGETAYKEELERLKSLVKVCLLKSDEKGLYTYSGLKDRIQKAFFLEMKDYVNSEVYYPDFNSIPWLHTPTGEDRYYQTAAGCRLIAHKHAAVEMGTGLGKSRIIRNIVYEIGLKTLVVAPSVSIARMLYKDFVYHFGKSKVGLVGDGKKEYGKLITVGLFQSLTRVERDSGEWKSLSDTQVFIVDESHLTPASTLKQVCEGVAENAPYRFFFSGTQMRNDGADLLLEGIIGPVVYEMTVEQGVNEGFLSKPNFYMVEMDSPSSYISDNPDYMLDRHWYNNSELYKRACDIANQSVKVGLGPVLILIDEVTQFKHIWPRLTYDFGFAHGGVTKTNKAAVPEQYHDSDPEKLVDKFNDGQLSILVGTSCISIGTDIRTPQTLINLQGGTSEVKIRQAVGRGTRKTDKKSNFNYWDFLVKVKDLGDPDYESNVERHGLIRSNIYKDIFPSLRIVK